MTRDLFERYKDYILGDFVWGLSSTDLHGNQIQTPPWSLVLSYEQAVSKRSYYLMISEGTVAAWISVGTGLEMSSHERKALHYATCPLQQAFLPKPELGRMESQGEGQRRKGLPSKGKSKGKGPGVTPEECVSGSILGNKCSYQKCKFSHVCNKCFKKGHNALNCRDEKPAPDTTGAH